jgi:hypothetical protein
MTRRRSAARAGRAMEPAADLGPDILRHRGEVMTLDAPDPDSPNRTIRRAKRVWAPDVLLKNGSIDQAMHDAATRLHDAYALGVQGARDRLTVYVDRTGSPSGYADGQLAAARDYREAAQAVGQIGMAPLAWCVLSHGTVEGWAAEKRLNPHAAKGQLLMALEMLAQHYDCC